MAAEFPYERKVQTMACAIGVVVCSACLLPAETEVGGTLSTSMWTADESPYRVTERVDVPEGVTLTIGEGVVVTLDEDVAIIVEGTVRAVGTAEQPIQFQGRDPERAWKGIAFVGSKARARLEHVELTGATTTDVSGHSYKGVFNVVGGAKASLSHCWLHDFRVPIVESNGGSELVIRDSLIEGGREGIHSNRSYALLERVHVRNMFGYSDSIDFDFDSTPQSVIRDCLVEENEEDDGIDLGSATALVENVIIRGVRAGKAISMDGESSPIIRRVLIYDCQQGVVIKDSCTPELEHLTITRCDTGIDCYEKFNGRGGGHGTGENLIVWGNNEEQVALDRLSTFVTTYSTVGGGYPGEGNAEFAPLFVDPAGNDFHLRPESPAIGAGTDGQDMGAYGGTPPTTTFLRGDSNGDSQIDVSDAVAVLLYLFRGTVTPGCLDALDADDSGQVNVTDALFVLGFVLRGGPSPLPPYPLTGVDPTGADPYDCETPLLYLR